MPTDQPKMSDRYEVPGKAWVGNQKLSVAECGEVRRALEFIFDTLCSYQSMDEFPEVDNAFCTVYVALKFLKPGYCDDDT